MQAFVNLTCPYCGHKQSAIVDFADHKPYTRPQVVICDSEEGGCDKWYVFEARATFTVTTGTIGGDLQPTEQPGPEALAVVVPDWTKAPDWAQWWAADGDGSGNWYECVPAPTADGDYWENPSGERYKLSNDQYGWTGDYWYRSLEQRTQAVQP